MIRDLPPLRSSSRRDACAMLFGLALIGAVPAGAATKPGKPRPIEWMELLPENERRNAPGSGEPQHDYLGEDGPGAKQQGSARVNPALDNLYVKLPGFIVPLTLRQEKIVSEFLLVPYFGACIHVPPPPPNQIVYVKLDKPTPINTIWEPYWITGTLTTTVKDTRTASTAYTLAGVRIESYEK
jgi:uncharacterized protein